MRQGAGQRRLLYRIGHPALVETGQTTEKKGTHDTVKERRYARAYMKLMGEYNGRDRRMMQTVSIVAHHRIPTVCALVARQPFVLPPYGGKNGRELRQDLRKEIPPSVRIDDAVPFQWKKRRPGKLATKQMLGGPAAGDGDPAPEIFERTDQWNDPSGMTQPPIQGRYEYVFIFVFF
jgi:hypothetical protein